MNKSKWTHLSFQSVARCHREIFHEAEFSSDLTKHSDERGALKSAVFYDFKRMTKKKTRRNPMCPNWIHCNIKCYWDMYQRRMTIFRLFLTVKRAASCPWRTDVSNLQHTLTRRRSARMKRWLKFLSSKTITRFLVQKIARIFGHFLITTLLVSIDSFVCCDFGPTNYFFRVLFVFLSIEFLIMF